MVVYNDMNEINKNIIFYKNLDAKNKNDTAQPQTNSEGILNEIKSVLTSIQSDVRTLGTKGGK